MKRKQSFGWAADWYMFGHYVYSALAGHELMGKEVPCSEEVKFQGEVEGISKEAMDIIEKLTIGDPLKRLGSNGTDEIMGHAFFKEVDWDMLRMKKVGLKNRPEKGNAELREEH